MWAFFLMEDKDLTETRILFDFSLSSPKRTHTVTRFSHFFFRIVWTFREVPVLILNYSYPRLISISAGQRLMKTRRVLVIRIRFVSQARVVEVPL